MGKRLAEKHLRVMLSWVFSSGSLRYHKVCWESLRLAAGSQLGTRLRRGHPRDSLFPPVNVTDYVWLTPVRLHASGRQGFVIHSEKHTKHLPDAGNGKRLRTVRPSQEPLWGYLTSLMLRPLATLLLWRHLILSAEASCCPSWIDVWGTPPAVGHQGVADQYFMRLGVGRQDFQGQALGLLALTRLLLLQQFLTFCPDQIVHLVRSLAMVGRREGK